MHQAGLCSLKWNRDTTGKNSGGFLFGRFVWHQIRLVGTFQQVGQKNISCEQTTIEKEAHTKTDGPVAYTEIVKEVLPQHLENYIISSLSCTKFKRRIFRFLMCKVFKVRKSRNLRSSCTKFLIFSSEFSYKPVVVRAHIELSNHLIK